MRAASSVSAVSRLFGRSFYVAWVIAIVAALFSAPVLAQPVVIPSVPGSSNPYLSGMPDGSTCCSGDSAPAQSPVQVTGLTLVPGSGLTFSATGGVNFDGGTPTSGPDGSFFFATVSSNGISGATWPVNALVGVFLDDSLPTSSAAPASLDFSAGAGTGFTTLSPALKQAFFIGDGLTGTGSGATQSFVIPAGATRLFLGTSDGVGWFNNSGSFAVTVTAVAAPPPAAAPLEIPTLALPMFIVLAFALAAIAARVIRRA
jgi:hypothetical protein